MSHPPAKDITLSWSRQPSFYSTGLTLTYPALLTIKNNGSVPLVGWNGQPNFVIYTSANMEPLSDNVTVVTQNITFTSVTPTSTFQTVDPGQTTTVLFANYASAFLRSDFFFDGVCIQFADDPTELSHYLSVDQHVNGRDPNIMRLTNEDLTLFLEAFFASLGYPGISESDSIPIDTPHVRYGNGNPDLSISLQRKLVPYPVELQLCDTDSGLSLDAKLIADGCPWPKLSKQLSKLTKSCKGEIPVKIKVVKIDDGMTYDTKNVMKSGGYLLKITKSIKIVVADSDGLTNAISTLIQLIDIQIRDGKCTWPTVLIRDYPRFGYRSIMIDISRHFDPIENLFKLIDQFALRKLNHFHLHLSDDEGWRLEIPGIPELIEYGSRVAFWNNPYPVGEITSQQYQYGSTNNLEGDDDKILGKPKNALKANIPTTPPENQLEAANFHIKPKYQGYERNLSNFVGYGDGYITRDQFIALLKYAKSRGIRIVPEFDAPAHSRSAVLSMEYRYQKYAVTDPVKANEYRLIDPNDTGLVAYDYTTVNPLVPGTTNFYTKVLSELAKMYSEACADFEYYHIGGDEVAGGVWSVVQSSKPVV